MRFSIITTFLAVAASVSANLVVKRDAATVLKDIATIQSKAIKLNQTVSNFKGDTVTALAINSQSSDLANSLDQATKDAQASSAFSNTDAANIVNAIVGLEPAVYDSLNTLIAKYQQFQTVVLGFSANGLVKSDLQQLQTSTDNFSAAVTAKLPTVLARLSPFLVGNLDYHYFLAITRFSS